MIKKLATSIGSIYYVNRQVEVPIVRSGMTVLEVLIEAGYEISHSCGGMAACGTCCVQVQSDLKQLPARNELEDEMAVAMDYSESERLSCQLTAYSGLKIKV